MSKETVLLKALRSNLNQWVCGFCNSNSNQPAAIFRELKKKGFSFEEVSPNRWANNQFCNRCNTIRSHYKLLSHDPVFAEKPRFSISSPTRQRILRILGGKDAFTGGSITSTPEIDHKVPYSRLENDINSENLDDDELKAHFQLLTREHNLLKDRACNSCRISGNRPPFLEIPFWYSGTNLYENSCVGCGWHDSTKWREELTKLLSSIKKPN